MAYESVEYPAAVRGFHVYRRFWQPEENQVMLCSNEFGNIHNMFAIKTYKEDESGEQEIVGHLPIELSRLTKFLIDRGASVTATLSKTYYRRSVLVQGGLEIPCVIKAKMIGTVKNKEILARYLELVNNNYIDVQHTEKEVIVGYFVSLPVPDPNKHSGGSNVLIEASGGKTKQRKTKKKPNIQSFFKKSLEKENNKKEDVIIID